MGNVLVIGKGGREHALAWKLAQSPHVDKVYVAPGSVGMGNVATIVDIEESNFDALAQFALAHNVNLTVVGPDQPVADGIADFFCAKGLKIWGPSAKAARIESSKSFAKDLMQKYNIPTAAYSVFDDYGSAKDYLRTAQLPIVIKADGLAAGKGVAIADTLHEAEAALKEMMHDGKYGTAGSTILFEEFLEGEEFSFMAFVVDNRVYPMELSRDYKRAYDGDEGPNTGGMGAYSPVPCVSQEVINEAVVSVLQKTANAMVQEGCPFTGFLYGGLMATASGVKVIEFNARFGDPEAEVLLPRLESDLYEIITTLLEGGSPIIEWSKNATVGVVVASEGYPEKPLMGNKLEWELSSGTFLFHCGTLKQGGDYVTNGGRVLILVASGESIEAARRKVYDDIKNVKGRQIFYRTDIARRSFS